MANGDAAAAQGFTPVAATDDFRLGYDGINRAADLAAVKQRTFSAASSSAMAALKSQLGDWCYRSDLDIWYRKVQGGGWVASALPHMYFWGQDSTDGRPIAATADTSLVIGSVYSDPTGVMRNTNNINISTPWVGLYRVTAVALMRGGDISTTQAVALQVKDNGGTVLSSANQWGLPNTGSIMLDAVIALDPVAAPTTDASIYCSFTNPASTRSFHTMNRQRTRVAVQYLGRL